jgi:hypothetical protein
VTFLNEVDFFIFLSELSLKLLIHESHLFELLVKHFTFSQYALFFFTGFFILENNGNNYGFVDLLWRFSAQTLAYWHRFYFIHEDFFLNKSRLLSYKTSICIL